MVVSRVLTLGLVLACLQGCTVIYTVSAGPRDGVVYVHAGRMPLTAGVYRCAPSESSDNEWRKQYECLELLDYRALDRARRATPEDLEWIESSWRDGLEEPDEEAWSEASGRRKEREEVRPPARSGDRSAASTRRETPENARSDAASGRREQPEEGRPDAHGAESLEALEAQLDAAGIQKLRDLEAQLDAAGIDDPAVREKMLMRAMGAELERIRSSSAKDEEP